MSLPFGIVHHMLVSKRKLLYKLWLILLNPEIKPDTERVYSVIVDFQIKREWSCPPADTKYESSYVQQIEFIFSAWP